MNHDLLPVGAATGLSVAWWYMVSVKQGLQAVGAVVALSVEG
jgi:hypothetical protein